MILKYKVRELRKKKNLTQIGLSKKAGVSRTVISNLESGKEFRTSTHTLNKVAEALGTTVDKILLP